MIAVFSCKRASQLLSDSLDRVLSGREKTTLWTHLLLCSMCRKVRRHLRFLQSFREHGPDMIDTLYHEHHLPDDARKAIQEILDAHKNNPES